MTRPVPKAFLTGKVVVEDQNKRYPIPAGVDVVLESPGFPNCHITQAVEWIFNIVSVSILVIELKVPNGHTHS